MIALLLQLYIFQEPEKMIESYDDEPEHYSWNLGTPDNQVETEIIIDPYELAPIERYGFEGQCEN